jgi:hypothetical protein
MHRSEERAALNEITFREANAKIDAKRRELGIEDRTPYLCECEDESCTRLILLTVEEYDHARTTPRRFLVIPGHEHRDEVVEEHGEYQIVEKSGLGGRMAEEADG